MRQYLRSESWTRSLLKQLLVAPLNTAVSLTQMNNVAVHVGQHLHNGPRSECIVCNNYLIACGTTAVAMIIELLSPGQEQATADT